MSLDVLNTEQVMVNCGTIFSLGGSSKGVNSTSKNIIPDILTFFVFK